MCEIDCAGSTVVARFLVQASDPFSSVSSSYLPPRWTSQVGGPMKHFPPSKPAVSSAEKPPHLRNILVPTTDYPIKTGLEQV